MTTKFTLLNVSQADEIVKLSFKELACLLKEDPNLQVDDNLWNVALALRNIDSKSSEMSSYNFYVYHLIQAETRNEFSQCFDSVDLYTREGPIVPIEQQNLSDEYCHYCYDVASDMVNFIRPFISL